MAKTFKRIAALATAIALVVCFAVSASAAITVTTTTKYATDDSNVNVSVNVTGVENAEYVTYYATNGSTPVYIDQAKLSAAGAANFNFQTAATNLNSTVKLGYTDAQEAKGAYIEANTVSYDGEVLETLPTEGATSATVTFDFDCDADKTVDASCVTATKATVTSASMNAAKTEVTIVLDNISGDVDLTITPRAAGTVVPTIVPTFIDAGALVLTADNLGEDASFNQGEVGDRKVTVIGKAGKATTYGVIVTTDEIAATEYTASDFETTFADCYYVAQAKDDAKDGLFAVQIIDNAGDGEEVTIEAGENYNTAVYVVAADGKYYIAKGSVVNAQQ